MSKQTIGARIKSIRNRLGVSQDAFAMLFNEGQDETIATTREDIAKYELGINSVPAQKYVRFLELEPLDELYIKESNEEVEAKLRDAGITDSDALKSTDMPMGGV